MSARLTTIERRWARYPRLRYLGDRPTARELRAYENDLPWDDEWHLPAELLTRDERCVMLAEHDDASPVKRKLLVDLAHAPEDVRWLLREVARLRRRLEASEGIVDAIRALDHRDGPDEDAALRVLDWVERGCP